MDKIKSFLILQSLVCILVVLVLSFATIGVYREGKLRNESDPTAEIYTSEAVEKALVPCMVLVIFGIGITAAGAVMGIRDEEQDKPVIKTDKEYILKKRIPEGVLSKLRVVLVGTAIAFIIAGILTGNLRAVMIKAINVCTECVGLG